MTRVLLAGLLALAASGVGFARPAHAHSADADRATNYQTAITSTPDVDGLSVRLVDAGSRIEVRNGSGVEVVVQGYAGEPYLRLTDAGVWENRRSPAAWLNRSLTSDTEVPDAADPHAAPEWVRVSDEPVARWHDHRAHWMGVVDPEVVRADPGGQHVVIPGWEIPLEVDGELAVVRGDVVWVPGPPLWPWLVAGTVVAAAVAVAGWSRRWRLVAVAVAAGCGVTVVTHAAVALLAAPVPAPMWWIVALGAVTGALVVGVGLLHRRPRVGVAVLGAAGVAATGLVGLVDRAWLVHSRLPVDFDAWAARGVVAAATALGLGLAGLALVRWSQPAPAGAGPGGSDQDPAAAVPVGLAAPDR